MTPAAAALLIATLVSGPHEDALVSGPHEDALVSGPHEDALSIGPSAGSSTVAETGRLLVISNESGARVFVDDRDRGLTPIPPISLLPGLHRVRVTKPGSEPFVAVVEIRPGALARLEARLSPQSIYAPLAIGEPGIETGREGHQPVITRWWFWGVVAVLGAAVVVTGVRMSAGNDFVPMGELGATDTADWPQR